MWCCVQFVSRTLPPFQREMTEVRCRKPGETDEAASEVHQQHAEGNRLEYNQLNVWEMIIEVFSLFIIYSVFTVLNIYFSMFFFFFILFLQFIITINTLS